VARRLVEAVGEEELLIENDEGSELVGVNAGLCVG
jgi:hypothetical protein